MAIAVGQPAPEFKLLDRERQAITRESFPGKHLVLAFYPLAFTGGCTNEMTAFRTYTDAFARANAQVVGVSVDSWAAAGEFQDKLGLEFPLASDFPFGPAGKEYGAFNEKLGFHNRLTVLLDKDRVVRDVYLEPRDFESHATHVLDVLKSLGEDPGLE
jgi:peroxiredoxin